MSLTSSGAAWTLAASVWLAPPVGVLEDPDGVLHIETVSAQAEAFVPLEASDSGLGITDSVWWLRLPLQPSEGRRLLVVPYTQNDILTLYCRVDGRWVAFEAGDRAGRGQRRIDHPYPVFPIEPGVAGPVYLRVASSGSVMVPLELWPERAFWQHNGVAQAAYGLYYAFILALALYNLFLWTAVRDSAYLYYVLYLTGLLVFQANYSGHAPWLLWPESPAWANAATIVGLAGAIGFGTLFVVHLGHLREAAPRWRRALLPLVPASAAAAVLVWWSYRAGMVLAIGCAAAALPLFLGAVIASYRAGVRQARFLALGFISFTPGAILLLLRALGVVPDNWWTEHSYQLGTALEVLLLSFALADRIKIVNAERDRAREALAAQRTQQAQRLADAQEAERRRIAQDLHDGVAPELLTLLPPLRKLAHPDLAPVEAGLRQSIAELRRVAQELYPQQLDRLGLTAALESLAERMAEVQGLALEAEIEDLPVARGTALEVYRIAQEALQNILRHARARRLRISWRRCDGSGCLCIEDDGQGPPQTDANEAKVQAGSQVGLGRAGLGLASMGARADRLGAQLHFEAARPGTRLRLDGVPLAGPEEATP